MTRPTKETLDMLRAHGTKSPGGYIPALLAEIDALTAERDEAIAANKRYGPSRNYWKLLARDLTLERDEARRIARDRGDLTFEDADIIALWPK